MDEIKVLIVDDEVEFASALAERLELRGYILKIANCGRDALAIIDAEFAPDVILLDLKMPDMSGCEVLAELDIKCPAIEVIILTGHGTASCDGDEMEADTFGFIMKPVDFRELEEKIKEASQKQVSGS